MTAATRRPRKRDPRPLLPMPPITCDRAWCTNKYGATGDYVQAKDDAAAAGWLLLPYVRLCPAHKGEAPWWPAPARRLAIAAPDVPRPGPTVSAAEGAMPVNAPAPGDLQPDPHVIPTVEVGGVHLPITADAAFMDDLARDIATRGQVTDAHLAKYRDHMLDREYGPGDTVSFAAIDETQPFIDPRYAELTELARRDAEEAGDT